MFAERKEQNMKTKRILALILAALTLLALISCDKEETPGETEESVKYFDLLVDGKAPARFIRPDKSPLSLTRGLSALYSSLTTEYPDAGFKVKSDHLAPGEAPAEKEILVGLTNREGAEEFNASVPANCFVIEVTETHIRIDGYNDSHVRLALEYFQKNYLAKDEQGNIRIPVGRYVSEPVTLTVKDLVKETPTMKTSSSAFLNIPAIDGKRVMQGGCTDGKYLYAFMVNSGDSQTAYVHKINLETRETEKISKELKTDHSNDGTYVSKTNEIYICHNAPNRTKVTIIDADTLEYKKTITIPYSIFSIAYREDKDVFVLGISGGQNFTVVDRETFRVNKEFVTSGDRFIVNSTGYTTQGVECDDQYIYFVQYKQNVIIIYDWTGKFITRVNLDIQGCEPENISIVGDKFYIQCNNSSWTGGIVYQSELVAEK